MKNKIVKFYLKEKIGCEKSLESVQKKIAWIGTLRFLVFCISVFFIYYFLGEVKIMAFAGLLGFLIFLALLNKSVSIKLEQKILFELKKINSIEIECSNGNYSDLLSGEEFKSESHFYSNDIDIFGVNSFFQYINRTGTSAGKIELQSILTSNKTDEIYAKQVVVNELANKPNWRQQFSAVANLVSTIVPLHITLNWIEGHRRLLPNKAILLSNIFALITLGLFSAMLIGILKYGFMLYWYLLGAGISNYYGTFVKKIHDNSTKARLVVKQYYRLLELIENETYTSKTLQSKQSALKYNNKNVSEIFKEFSKTLDALDQRENLIIRILGNGLFLWDLKQASKIEGWLERYQNKVKVWFKIVSFFDAQNSLANFAFNHPNYTFPEITDTDIVIHAKDLGHPLLDVKKRITNDCLIKLNSLLIITGSNMAGKSTFLRTVSLSIVMANIGLPVCASEMKYSPVKLLTSMRTADSLAKDTSYFFSELKRLKLVIEALQQEHYFVVLDEILKGTNSIDKAEGSKQFLKKLLQLNATGLIATHDLSLCTLTDMYEQIQNAYFDGDILEDELHFDYKLKQGVSKNRNASFLLKKMKIV